MVKIALVGGVLYQWDTDRKVQIYTDEDTSIDEVHFTYGRATHALVTLPPVVDGVMTADIPNIALQIPGVIGVHVTVETKNGERTLRYKSLFVASRKQPSDYVYTETEVLNYETLLKRVDQIETNGVSDDQIEKAVTKYLDENPIDTGVQFETDKTLTLEDGVLSVNTADVVEEDNTLPVTSAAVYTEVGNINALLETI